MTSHLRSFLLALALSGPAAASPSIVPVNPAEGAFIAADELVVVASLSVDSAAYAILSFDSAAVTAGVESTPEALIWVVPQGSATPGPHSAGVTVVGAGGDTLAVRQWRFTVLLPGEEAGAAEGRGGRVMHNGRLFGELRQYSLAGKGSLEAVTGGMYRGSSGRVRYGADVQVGNLNDRMSQDRNVYSAQVALGKALRLKVGDTRPQFQAGIVNGQRIRGMEAGVSVVSRESGDTPLTLEFALGRARRPVAPHYSSRDTAWEFGTYARTIGAGRVSAGAGRVFRVGLTALKGKDDAGSIGQVRDSAWSPLDSAYMFTDGRPAEDNVVIGGDLVTRPAGERLELYGSYALSLYTRDINDGAITRADLEKALGSVPIDPAAFANFLIANASTTPLYPGAGILNSSLLGAGARLELPLGGAREQFRVDYQLRGANYHSMGDPLLGPSGQGIRITESLFLLSSRLALRGGYSWHRNNLDNVQASATVTRQGSAGASLFYSPRAPGVTIDLARTSTDNADTVYGFGTGVSTLNASVVQNYRLACVSGVAQVFTGWIAIDNHWKNVVYNSVRTVGADTAVGFVSSVHGLSIRADLDEVPLNLTGGVMSNAGNERFLKMTVVTLHGRYSLVPELLSANGGVRIGGTRMPGEDYGFHVSIPYGADFRHRAGHRIGFNGYMTSDAGEWDFVNMLRYEWRF